MSLPVPASYCYFGAERKVRCRQRVMGVLISLNAPVAKATGNISGASRLHREVWSANIPDNGADNTAGNALYSST